MMIIMHPGASKEQVQNVIAVIEKQHLSSHVIEGVEQTIIGAVGEGHYVAKEVFEALPGVLSVQRISQPYKLASRQFHEHDSVFQLDGFSVGAAEIPIIAGPCAVEFRVRDSRNRTGGERIGRERIARRSFQASHIAVFIPGTGRGRS